MLIKTLATVYVARVSLSIRTVLLLETQHFGWRTKVKALSSLYDMTRLFYSTPPQMKSFKLAYHHVKMPKADLLFGGLYL